MLRRNFLFSSLVALPPFKSIAASVAPKSSQPTTRLFYLNTGDERAWAHLVSSSGQRFSVPLAVDGFDKTEEVIEKFKTQNSNIPSCVDVCMYRIVNKQGKWNILISYDPTYKLDMRVHGFEYVGSDVIPRGYRK
jgi:hypothetical protein